MQNNTRLFLHGATESNNLAIRGLCHAYKNRGRHIITTPIEHASVHETIEELEAEGFRVTYIDVKGSNSDIVKQVQEAICEDTILISCMHVNNEIRHHRQRPLLLTACALSRLSPRPGGPLRLVQHSRNQVGCGRGRQPGVVPPAMARPRVATDRAIQVCGRAVASAMSVASGGRAIPKNADPSSADRRPRERGGAFGS